MLTGVIRSKNTTGKYSFSFFFNELPQNRITLALVSPAEEKLRLILEFQRCLDRPLSSTRFAPKKVKLRIEASSPWTERVSYYVSGVTINRHHLRV